MITRLLAAAALASAVVTPLFATPGFVASALAAGNSARDLAPSHGISCAQGIRDMEKEAAVAPVRGRQQQDALQGIEAARQACESGDSSAAERKLAGVRQLLAGE